MIEHVLSVICKDCIIDQRTNLVSYINCFEEVVVGGLPVQLMEVNIATLWRKKTADHVGVRIRVMVRRPDGELKEVGTGAATEPDKKTHRINFVLNGFPIDQEGNYIFSIEYQDGNVWKVASTLPLVVKKGK